jgi:hypothetical protein
MDRVDSIVLSLDYELSLSTNARATAREGTVILRSVQYSGQPRTARPSDIAPAYFGPPSS